MPIILLIENSWRQVGEDSARLIFTVHSESVRAARHSIGPGLHGEANPGGKCGKQIYAIFFGEALRYDYGGTGVKFPNRSDSDNFVWISEEPMIQKHIRY
jgi:hypothetical protein